MEAVGATRILGYNYSKIACPKRARNEQFRKHVTGSMKRAGVEEGDWRLVGEEMRNGVHPNKRAFAYV